MFVERQAFLRRLSEEKAPTFTLGFDRTSRHDFTENEWNALREHPEAWAIPSFTVDQGRS